MTRQPESMTTGEQGLRYLIVGGWNTVFGYGVFALFNLALGDRIHYLLLLLPATAIAILNSYVCYRAFVFKVQGHWWRDLLRFASVYVGAFFASLALLPLLVEVAGIPVLVAQAIVIAATVVASFISHRSFSFKRT